MGGLGCDNMTVILLCILHENSYEDLADRCSKIPKPTSTANENEDTLDLENEDTLDLDTNQESSTPGSLNEDSSVSEVDRKDEVNQDSINEDSKSEGPLSADSTTETTSNDDGKELSNQELTNQEMDIG